MKKITHRSRWIAAAAICALTVLFVVPQPADAARIRTWNVLGQEVGTVEITGDCSDYGMTSGSIWREIHFGDGGLPAGVYLSGCED